MEMGDIDQVQLDQLTPPIRDITSPMRLPVSNVFKGQRTGVAASGRICGGVVQVGEKLAVVPGEETAIVKCMRLPSLHDKID